MHSVEVTVGYEIIENPVYEAEPSSERRRGWRREAYEHTFNDAAAGSEAIINLARTFRFEIEPDPATTEDALQAALGPLWQARIDTKKREHVFIEGEWICETSYTLQKSNGMGGWVDYEQPFDLNGEVLTAKYRVGTREKHTWDGA